MCFERLKNDLRSIMIREVLLWTEQIRVSSAMLPLVVTIARAGIVALTPLKSLTTRSVTLVVMIILTNKIAKRQSFFS